MFEETRPAHPDPEENPVAESTQPVPVIPAAPDQIEVLRQHPERARAVPSFIRLEGVNHQQLAALFEKLEYPIGLDGIEQFETALRTPKAHFSARTFTSSQLDGCPVDILISQQSRVGENEFKTGGSVSIAPNDMTSPYDYITVTLDTLQIEKGQFNLTLDFNQDYIFGRSLFDESWETLDTLLEILETDPVPQSLEEVEFICSTDNCDRLCVVAPVTQWSLLGMLPRVEQVNDETPAEKDAEPPPLIERSPQRIMIFNPSVAELRFLARELNPGEAHEFSEFDGTHGENSFLSNARNMVASGAPTDLNTWEMYKLSSRLMISVNQLITIGNGEYGIGMAHTATAFRSSSDNDQELDSAESEQSYESGQTEDEEGDEDLPSFGVMNDIAAPEISISPCSEHPDLSLVLSMESPPNDDDTKKDAKVLTATLQLGTDLTREQAWAIVDRITEYFEETRLSTDPLLSALPTGTPFFELGRVFLLVPSPSGRLE